MWNGMWNVVVSRWVKSTSNMELTVIFPVYVLDYSKISCFIGFPVTVNET